MLVPSSPLPFSEKPFDSLHGLLYPLVVLSCPLTFKGTPVDPKCVPLAQTSLLNFSLIYSASYSTYPFEYLIRHLTLDVSKYELLIFAHPKPTTLIAQARNLEVILNFSLYSIVLKNVVTFA